jgi:hypothetical protein
MSRVWCLYEVLSLLRYAPFLCFSSYQVWLGLPDPEKCQDPKKFAAALASMNECVLTGFLELPHSDQRAFVDHCRGRGNWAARRKSKKKNDNKQKAAPPSSTVDGVHPEAAASNAVASSTNNATATLVPSSSSRALVAPRQKFVMPRPGVNGASVATVFQGQTFVLTGTFPEVGGGAGLGLGKDRVKKMLESFGGRVTSAVSGKTNVLVVGKDPGMSKVSKGRQQTNCLLASIKDLKLGLDTGCQTIEAFEVYNRGEPLMIQSFSKGYGNNSLALTASKKDLATARGQTPATKKKKPKATAVVGKIEENSKKQASKTTAVTATTKTRKRGALKDVPNDMNEDDSKSARTVTKKRKASERVAKKIEEETSTALVVATNSTRKTRAINTRKAAANKGGKAKSKMRATEQGDEEEEGVNVITCDLCVTICTDQSWFLSAKEEDFCSQCHAKEKIEGAVFQRNGQTVE